MQAQSTAGPKGRAHRRVPALLAALAALALIMVADDAHAQLFPAQPAVTEPVPTAERTLIDATFRVIPPAEGAPCMQIDAGTLTVRVANLEQRSDVRPTTFRFQGYRGEDGGVQLAVLVTQQESSTVVHLAGALYCWSLAVYAPVADDAGMAVRTNYTQLVAVKMTLTQP